MRKEITKSYNDVAFCSLNIRNFSNIYLAQVPMPSLTSAVALTLKCIGAQCRDPEPLN